MAPDKDI